MKYKIYRDDTVIETKKIIEWNKLMRALYPKDRSKVFKKTDR